MREPPDGIVDQLLHSTRIAKVRLHALPREHARDGQRGVSVGDAQAAFLGHREQNLCERSVVVVLELKGASDGKAPREPRVAVAQHGRHLLRVPEQQHGNVLARARLHALGERVEDVLAKGRAREHVRLVDDEHLARRLVDGCVERRRRRADDVARELRRRLEDQLAAREEAELAQHLAIHLGDRRLACAGVAEEEAVQRHLERRLALGLAVKVVGGHLHQAGDGVLDAAEPLHRVELCDCRQELTHGLAVRHAEQASVDARAKNVIASEDNAAALALARMPLRTLKYHTHSARIGKALAPCHAREPARKHACHIGAARLPSAVVLEPPLGRAHHADEDRA